MGAAGITKLIAVSGWSPVCFIELVPHFLILRVKLNKRERKPKIMHRLWLNLSYLVQTECATHKTLLLLPYEKGTVFEQLGPKAIHQRSTCTRHSLYSLYQQGAAEHFSYGVEKVAHQSCPPMPANVLIPLNCKLYSTFHKSVHANSVFRSWGSISIIITRPLCSWFNKQMSH